MTQRPHGVAVMALIALAALGMVACREGAASERVTLRMWAMGREGEVVQQLIPEFERKNPGIRVHVQQIPWTAAHEKLLTAYVGEATPDLSQLGNTWIPEFGALGALEPLDARIAHSTSVSSSAFFPGIWSTNLLGDTAFGVPWYVDTRVLFYRTDLLARAGVSAPPTTWAEWTDAMHKVKALGGPTKWAIVLPLDEWAQPVIFAFQAGSPLLQDGGRFGAFEEPAFRRAFEFYVRLFRDGLAPALANTQIANVYQEFAAGTFAMYITGPWNIGEFRSRLPDSLQNAWATAPLPGPTGPGQSIAGGASLVVYRASKHKAEAWKLVEFLSSREQELRFYALTGDLPARTDAWRDTSLSNDRHARAFYDQLQRVEPLPKVPEWELIATRIAAAAEQVARGRATTDVALAALDRDVNQMLEKRRWMLARHGVQAAARAMTPTGAR